MRELKRRVIGLCLVPVLLAVLDGSVTLIGQPVGYWGGDYSQALEGTPAFRILLRQGPAVFMAGLAIYMSAFVGMIVMLPRTLALAICLQFTLGHTIGAFSWINRFPHTRMLPIVINSVAALSLALGIRWVWTSPLQEDTLLVSSLPTVTRWALVATLCFITILFMLPWE